MNYSLAQCLFSQNMTVIKIFTILLQFWEAYRIFDLLVRLLDIRRGFFISDVLTSSEPFLLQFDPLSVVAGVDVATEPGELNNAPDVSASTSSCCCDTVSHRLSLPLLVPAIGTKSTDGTSKPSGRIP